MELRDWVVRGGQKMGRAGFQQGHGGPHETGNAAGSHRTTWRPLPPPHPGLAFDGDEHISASGSFFGGLFQRFPFCPEQLGRRAGGQRHPPAAAEEGQRHDPQQSPHPEDPPVGLCHHQRDPLHLLERGEDVLMGSPQCPAADAGLGARSRWTVPAVGGGGWGTRS